jgi:hypothetical protein
VYSLLEVQLLIIDLGDDGNTTTVKAVVVLRLYGLLWNRLDCILHY